MSNIECSIDELAALWDPSLHLILEKLIHKKTCGQNFLRICSFLILEALTVPDFIVFSSVCRSWHYVYTITQHNRCPYEEPWLMYSGGEKEPNTVFFYNISSQKEMKIGNQPGLSLYNRIFLGSAHGWMITADEKSELSLVNPITRQQIDLPPVMTFGHFIPIEYDANGEVTHYLYKKEDKIYDKRFTAEELRHCYYEKATLAHPQGVRVQDDYTVVIILANVNCIAFARCEDNKWTTLPGKNYRQEISCDIKEAKVYTAVWSGMIESWDFTNRDHKPEPVIYVPEDRKLAGYWCEYMFYLVQTPWGDIWHVRRRGKGNICKGNYLTRKIWIYKVDFARKKLIRVKSIGDYALFLGLHIPLCISCKDNPNLKPNSVYFVDDDFEKCSGRRKVRRDIGIYCLADRSIEVIMPENSLLKWPPPIWLQPSLV